MEATVIRNFNEACKEWHQEMLDNRYIQDRINELRSK